MSRWPHEAISSLGTVVTGSTPRTSEESFYGGDTPFVTPLELDQIAPVLTAARTLSETGSHEVRLLPEGAVMVCCIGSLGKVGIAGREVATNQQINSVVFDIRRIWPRFGFYACRRLKSKLETMAPATTVPIVSKSKFERLEIPVPPLSEQQRIAEVLDRAEALRAKRRAALAQLDALTQSIFLDLFGDPLDSTSKWPRATFGDMLEHLAYGPRFYNETYSVNGIRIVRITDLDEAGHLDFDAMPHLTVDTRDREKYALHEGDLLFARSGSVGKSAVFPAEAPPCIAGAYFIVMRFKRNITHLFARSVLAADSVQRFIQSRSRQAIQPNFSGPALRALPLPIAPLTLQRAFARRIAAVEKLKTTYRASLAKLDALFASLQHRAFRREL